MSYTYYKNIFANMPLPLAYIDKDLLDKNIATTIARNGTSKTIRVASKSVRCVAMLQYILNSNPLFKGLMTYSASEALFLSQKGFDDLLMGYPTMGKEEIDGLCQEIKKGKKIVFMADMEAHIFLINEIAAKHGITAPICMDIDMSMDLPGLHFGVWRSSIFTPADVEKFVKACKSYKNIALVGIMGYEAQIAGVPDAVKGQSLKNGLVRLLKRRSIEKIAIFRQEAIDICQKEGINLAFVNGGGTGCLESTTQESGITETTVGSGFYAPTVFNHYVNFKYEAAAGFAVQIVRQPKPQIFTCLGAGYIASGEIGKAKQPLPYLPAGAKLIDLEGAGEVMTPVVYEGNETLNVGDPIFFRHAKAGELCERFTHLHLISHGKIVETVPTYRGEGQCFV